MAGGGRGACGQPLRGLARVAGHAPLSALRYVGRRRRSFFPLHHIFIQLTQLHSFSYIHVCRCIDVILFSYRLQYGSRVRAR